LRPAALPLALALMSTLAALPARAHEGPALGRKLEGIVARERGVVGVAVVNLADGSAAGVNEGQPFPMQSVYKLPIAIAVLAAVDAGKLRLDQPVVVRPQDISLGPDPRIWEQLPQTVTVQRLLQLMVQDSDNTACDRLMAMAGGGAAITALLRGKGIKGVTVSRPERQIAADACRFGGAKDCQRLTPPEKLRALRQQVERGLDVATPRALVDLLVALQRGRLLSPASTRQLLAMMEATTVGKARLRGLLPTGTVVAHRTGTGSLVVNDIGLITLPGDRGTLAIAVLIKESDRPTADRERTIAELARATHDHFAGPP
jgi:beta-lactamase class A